MSDRGGGGGRGGTGGGAEWASVLRRALAGDGVEVLAPSAAGACALPGPPPVAWVRPRDEGGVGAVLHAARSHGFAVVARGGGTQDRWGRPCRGPVVVLDLTGMTGVVRHEPGDLTIRLRPGTTLPQVRELLLPHGQTLPLEPPGWLRATVGGVMAGDAWGPSRLGYGGPRDVVLGLRVVDGAGRVFQTGGHVVKNVSGLDLGKLFVGSFGTLGVVVEVSCKLRPRAARRALWALPPVDAAAAWEGVGAIASGAFQPLAMVVAGAAERPRIFVVVEGGAAEVAAQLAELLAGYGPGVRARVRDLDPAGPPRGDAGEELGGAFDPEADRPALLLRCEVPEAQLQGLWRRLGSPSAPGPLHGVDGAELVAWVGLGVLWVRVPRAAAAATAALTAAVRAQAEEAGGRAVAVTDAPALAAGVDPWGNPGDLLPWFRRLKQRFDPDDVLAPGRFVGGI